MFMGATVFEIAGGGRLSPPPPPLVKDVGAKRLGKEWVKIQKSSFILWALFNLSLGQCLGGRFDQVVWERQRRQRLGKVGHRAFEVFVIKAISL